MPGRWRALAAAMVALAVHGCSTSVEKAEGAWGKADEGVQAMLHSPRAVLEAGQPIQLRVKLRNQTGEICNFPSSADLTLKVSRGDEAIADDLDYVTLAPEAITLSPGQELDLPLRQYATAGDAAKICKGPGLYRFRGQLGKLELPPVEVRVE